jgi:hypothetical protein
MVECDPFFLSICSEVWICNSVFLIFEGWRSYGFLVSPHDLSSLPRHSVTEGEHLVPVKGGTSDANDHVPFSSPAAKQRECFLALMYIHAESPLTNTASSNGTQRGYRAIGLICSKHQANCEFETQAHR